MKFKKQLIGIDDKNWIEDVKAKKKIYKFQAKDLEKLE